MRNFDWNSSFQLISSCDDQKNDGKIRDHFSVGTALVSDKWEPAYYFYHHCKGLLKNHVKIKIDSSSRPYILLSYCRITSKNPENTTPDWTILILSVIVLINRRGYRCKRRILMNLFHGAWADLSNGGKIIIRLLLVFSVELGPRSSVSAHYCHCSGHHKRRLVQKEKFGWTFRMEPEQTFPMVAKLLSDSY